MHHHVDIRLRPDPELAPHHLMSGLYQRLHRALVLGAHRDIGVSFPHHDEQIPALGDVMRLHGSADALRALMVTPWLRGIDDHVHIERAGTVPANAHHCVVSRVQAKSGVERLRRRAMSRHGISAEEAAIKIPQAAAERLRLPFVTISSSSTGQTSFRLLIRHAPAVTDPVGGSFSSYGLSQGATVPWF